MSSSTSLRTLVLGGVKVQMRRLVLIVCHLTKDHALSNREIGIGDAAYDEYCVALNCANKRSQRYKERQYIDIDDMSVYSQNKGKVSVKPFRSMKSFVRTCCKEKEEGASHMTRLAPNSGREAEGSRYDG